MADVSRPRAACRRASSILRIFATTLVVSCGSTATRPSTSERPAPAPVASAPLPPASPEQPPAQTGEVLGEQARRLRFMVGSTETAIAEPEIDRGVRSALARAGYWLVDPPDEADAFLEVAVDDRRADRDAERSVSIRLIRDGAVLEWLVAPLPDGEHADLIHDLVDRLTASRGLMEVVDLVRPARTLVDARVARGPGAEGPTAAAPIGFSAAAARRCRNERKGPSCEQLAQHLAAFPRGEHASVAREVLRRAGYPLPAPEPPPDVEARAPESSP